MICEYYVVVYFSIGTSWMNQLSKNKSTIKGQPHQGIQGESIDPIYNVQHGGGCCRAHCSCHLVHIFLKKIHMRPMLHEVGNFTCHLLKGGYGQACQQDMVEIAAILGCGAGGQMGHGKWGHGLDGLGSVSMQAACPSNSSGNIDVYHNLVDKQPTWKVTLRTWAWG